MFLLFHNRVSNWHYHILHNGIVVEHSHPYSNAKKTGTPFQNHRHTDSEFLMLAELSNALTLLVVALVVAGMMLERTTQHSMLASPDFVFKPHCSSNLLRAPPVFSA
jgi:hypothetical protein